MSDSIPISVDPNAINEYIAKQIIESAIGERSLATLIFKNTLMFAKELADMLKEETPIRQPSVGDIQIDNDGTEWVIVGVTHLGLSRVKRNSLAHIVHAQNSPTIAKSYILPWGNSF